MADKRYLKISQYSNDLTLGSYYSRTFDVIGWTDEGDDSVLAVVATFANAKDAQEYATKDGRYLLVRPPDTYVSITIRWLSALSEASAEGVELRRAQ